MALVEAANGNISKGSTTAPNAQRKVDGVRQGLQVSVEHASGLGQGSQWQHLKGFQHGPKYATKHDDVCQGLQISIEHASGLGRCSQLQHLKGLHNGPECPTKS